MPKTLEILDLEKALQIVSGNRGLANELLAMLIKAIPEYRQNIKEQVQVSREALKLVIHKIHGGLRYIGAPALEEIISTTNNNLFELSENDLQRHIKLIFVEFDRLLKEEKYA